MNTRKCVRDNEVIEHFGDLTIQENVGKNSEIDLCNGSLTIHGNVEEGATINISISKEWQADIMAARFAKMRAAMDDIKLIGSPFRSYSNKAGNTYWGNVNINNRVYTDDLVTDLGNGIFEIKNMKGDLVKASIDGREYQGKEILIGTHNDDLNFKIDGQLFEIPPIRHPKPPMCQINGSVGNNVTIDGDTKIDITGTAGANCRFAKYYGAPVIHNRSLQQPITQNIESAPKPDVLMRNKF